MEKKEINNHLVACKKRVCQARLQCVNKIVHKIRKVAEIIEKHPNDNTKNKDKLRKSEQILQELKKINHVNILRKAIVYDKNPESIITDGKSTPEEVADALLFSHPTIKEIVSEVKTKFQLDDELNPGWKECITAASKKSKKNEKLENKRRKRAEKKQKNAQEKKRLEWLKENKIEGAEEPIEPLLENQNLSTQKPKTIRKRPDSEDEFGKETLPKKAKIVPTAKIFNSNEESANSDYESGSDQEEDINDNGEDKMIDPFFTTSSGELYKATAVEERIQPANKNDGLIRKERRDYMMGRHSNPRKDKNNIKSTDQNERFNGNAKKETIHPSWAAKQRQKGINGFAGKKKTFGEEDSTEKSEEKSNPSWFKDNGKHQGEKQHIQNVSKPDEKLHPSWLAKQKLKPVISTFQGKKISFENDD